MTRLSFIPDRTRRAFERACLHCLGEVPELERVASAAAAAVTAGRSARTARSTHYKLDAWMDWWEATGKTERPGSERMVRELLQHLKAKKRAAGTIYTFAVTMISFLTAIGWPDIRAAGDLKRESRRQLALHRRGNRTMPANNPVGWHQIQACLSVVDLTAEPYVRAVAAMLVLYDSLAREDAVFGHCEGRVWHVAPPRRSDLQSLPDGSGRLRLRTPTLAVGYFDAVLTPVTMTWLHRSLAWRQDDNGPLFLSKRGCAWCMRTWRGVASKLLNRAGITDRVVTGRALRAGKATDLAHEGVPLEAIRRAGFWTSVESVRLLVGVATPSGPYTGDLFDGAEPSQVGFAAPAPYPGTALGGPPPAISLRAGASKGNVADDPEAVSNDRYLHAMAGVDCD